MPSFRYTVALIVAGLIIAGAFAFASITRRAVHEQLRRDLRDPEQAGTLPRELEGPDHAMLSAEGFGTEMPHGMRLRIEISDFIDSLWFVWVPLVAAICVGTAFTMGKFSK